MYYLVEKSSEIPKGNHLHYLRNSKNAFQLITSFALPSLQIQQINAVRNSIMTQEGENALKFYATMMRCT